MGLVKINLDTVVYEEVFAIQNLNGDVAIQMVARQTTDELSYELIFI